jgi:hypothetical protein
MTPYADPVIWVIRILHVISASVEVYIRREFGERYIGWVHFFLSLILLNIVMTAFRIIYFLPMIGGGIYPKLSSIYWYSFIFLTGYHMLRIWLRNRQGIAWHSRSPGISYLSFLPIDQWILYRFVEPALCIAFSLAIRPLAPFTGNWLLFASLCLLIKSNLIFNVARGRVLDVVDAQIEAKVMSGELAGQDKRQSAGWSPVMVEPAILSASTEATALPDQDDFAAMVAARLNRGTDVATEAATDVDEADTDDITQESKEKSGL